MMHGFGKSHSLIVPAKPPNEAGTEAKEVVEGGGWPRGRRSSVTGSGHRAGRSCPARWSGYARARMGVSIATFLFLCYIGVITRGKSRMRQFRTSGSVAGGRP